MRVYVHMYTSVYTSSSESDRKVVMRHKLWAVTCVTTHALVAGHEIRIFYDFFPLRQPEPIWIGLCETSSLNCKGPLQAQSWRAAASLTENN